MKPFTKQFIAVLAALLLLLAGCKKEEPTITPASNSSITLPIFGNWKSVSYTRYWIDFAANPNPITSYSLDTGTVEIEIRADSTFQLWSDDYTITPDTGIYKIINGTITLIVPNRWHAAYNAPLIYQTDSTISVSLEHWAEYTFNDTGANAVLGDSAYSFSKYQFKRQ
jgi:hypothetical protein